MERKLFGAILTILFAATGVRGGSYCTDLSSYPYSRYCDNGCCGNYGDQYCCMVADVGKIVGIVIGSIASVVVVATILVIIFCCCRKSRGRAGVVNQPAAPNTAVVMYGQPAYGQPAYPVTTTYSPAPYTTTQIWQQPLPNAQTWQQSPPNAQTWQQPPQNTQPWQQPPPNSQTWAPPPPYQQTEAKDPTLPPPSAPTH